MPTIPLAASPVPRRRGRPNLLDRGRIVTEALAMLDPDGAAGLTMNRLARRLGVSAMTLYTYFPSREALLEEAANRVFSTFEPPSPDLPWRDAIRSWLWGLYRMFDRYPVGLRLIKWDGAVTPSWIGVWMHLLRSLGDAGLSGRTLLIGSNWVVRTGMALLMARVYAAEELALTRTAAARDPLLTDGDRALLADIPDEPIENYSDALFAFGVDNIIRGVEDLVAQGLAPRPMMREDM